MNRRRTFCCLGAFGVLGLVAGLAWVSNRSQNLARPYYDRVDRPMTLEELTAVFGRPPAAYTYGPTGPNLCWTGDDGTAVFAENRDGAIVRYYWIDRETFWDRLVDRVGLRRVPLRERIHF